MPNTKDQELADATPDKDNQQAADASDTAAEQVPLVTEENLRAPVKKGIDKPNIPDSERKIAEDAKKELLDNE
jgi:predicted carbohydrate-binding protein with CBM5 and CBM33 domain